jgi:hypothetical protein
VGAWFIPRALTVWIIVHGFALGSKNYRAQILFDKHTGLAYTLAYLAQALARGTMTELKLVTPDQRRLRPLVEAAIQNELRLLAAGIRRTEQRLRAFEEQYGLATAEFLDQYGNDQLEETLDFDEWVGEWRLLERLHDNASTLREIRFEN